MGKLRVLASIATVVATSQSLANPQSSAVQLEAPRRSTQIAKADELVAMGNAMADMGRYSEAITAYGLALDQLPGNGMILANRALAYAWINRVDDASKDLKEAEKTLKGVSILYRVRAIIANRRSDQDAELAALSKSLQLEPTNNFALTFRARIFQDRHQYEAAIADADAYIRARPDEPEAYELKASLLGGQRKWASAIDVASRLAQRFPREPRSLASVAEIYGRSGKRSEALEFIGRAISINNDAYYLWERRAGLRYWKDFEGRKADLQTALRLAPNDFGIVAKLGLLAFDGQLWAEANAQFTRILEKEPNDYLVRTFRAMTIVKMQNEAAADSEFKAASKAASGPGDLGRICSTLASRGVALGRAIEFCNLAIAKNSADFSYLTARGLTDLRSGEIVDAIADYDRAISGDNDDAYAYFGRAIAHLRVGQTGQATNDRLIALTIDPTIEEAFELMQITDFLDRTKS